VRAVCSASQEEQHNPEILKNDVAPASEIAHHPPFTRWHSLRRGLPGVDKCWLRIDTPHHWPAVVRISSAKTNLGGDLRFGQRFVTAVCVELALRSICIKVGGRLVFLEVQVPVLQTLLHEPKRAEERQAPSLASLTIGSTLSYQSNDLALFVIRICRQSPHLTSPRHIPATIPRRWR
jgi:hypothetical protein